ncbi:MAG: ABC transporter ATP-binding protein [Candidatus Rokuibacteriota bacterium]|nr:MAG: ABC transporter ATP-binding protein [Candidatus Rokubacteria bacterium]
MTDASVLDVEGLRVTYATRAGEVLVLPGLDFQLRAGEALGLVGESGCGKSTVALSIMRYLGRNGRIAGGRILFEGRDLVTLDDAALRAIRGRRIAMVYQDPMASLNPVMTVGRQLMEVPMIHEGADAAAARARALAMLGEVKLADAEAVMERYPHQLSGGQQQRIVIAMALIAGPALLIMDEPTTGLDVTVEAAVLDLVRELRQRHRSAILFISHNLGSVVRVCDRVGVMYRGELVEDGSVRQIFGNPRHPYTRGLLDCLPTLGRDKRDSPLVPIAGQVEPAHVRRAGCGFAGRCAHVEAGRCTVRPIPASVVDGEPGHRVACLRAEELEHWTRRRGAAAAAHDAAPAAEPVITVHHLTKVYEPRRRRRRFGAPRPSVRALADVDLAASRRHTLAIVGESGCGKSTLAKVLSGIEVATQGGVTLDGVEVGALPIDARTAVLKRKLQMVFQSPDSTLNPSHTVGYAIGRALRLLQGRAPDDLAGAIAKLLEVVRLPPGIAARKPRHLSGGEKQRVAIARALAGDPDVIVADEPVSALDVSVQAAVVNLLTEIQAARGATLIFISHDLAVVRYLADHVAVMYLGTVAEAGPVERIFAPPYHPYTEALLSAVPVPDPEHDVARILLEGPVPSANEMPRGCPFATRCPRRVGAICDDTPPPVQRPAAGHRIACHIPADELQRLQAPLVEPAPAGR